MPPLDALISQARTLAGDAHAEANRQLTVCNACRYCEGYCATMQAMARRLDFTRNDVDYLAHLCHNCGACLHACQYAPPHEFAIHIPNALKAVRETSYAEHAWPRALSRAYAQHGVVVSLVLALAIAGFLFAFSWVKTTGAPKDFYAMMSHTAMVGVFLPIFSFALFAIAMGALRFRRGHALAYERTPAREATQAALTMKYLDGGHGEGCPDDSDAPTHARRRFHHFTMYGFLLCFAATSVATLYHYALGRAAPYAWHDLPKLLGIVGGVGLLVGPLGLQVLYLRRNAASARQSFDLAFIMLLFFVSLTGFTLMFARGTTWLPAMLAIHLGFVFAFFATMPYSKFVHGVYRGLALLKFSIERRRPSAFTLKD